MSGDAGRRLVLAQAEELGGKKALSSHWDMKCRVALSTFIRRKRADRIPPKIEDGYIDWDRVFAARIPSDRGRPVDRSDPPAYPFSCPEDCDTCCAQYFPVQMISTDREALSEVQKLTHSIRVDLTYLRRALDSHADLIVTRWKKKSIDKRSALLLTVSPDASWPRSEPENSDAEPTGVHLYEKKWAPIHLLDNWARVFFGEEDLPSVPPRPGDDPVRHMVIHHIIDRTMRNELQEEIYKRHCTSWLLPYLDVESLAEEPLLFLSLLYNRTAYDPVSTECS
jgi:hypothetical protein